MVVRRAEGNEVAIKATLRMTSQERLAATTIAANRQGDGTLLIEAVPPNGEWEGNEGCSFEISAPDVQGVKIAANNGKIDIEGLAGDASLKTSDGSIVVRDHRGPLTVGTSNGSIKITGRPRPRRRPHLQRLGRCHLRRRCPRPPGRGHLQRPVEARLGKAYRGTLDLATSNGKVRLPENVKVHRKARTSASISVGEGGESTQVRTSNGSIRISR